MAWGPWWQEGSGVTVLTADDIHALVRMYDEAIRCSKGAFRPFDAIDRSARLLERHPLRSDFFLEHGRWMCQQMQIFDDLGKLNRWLGFVQCILVEQDIFSLDEMREHVRSYERKRRLIDEGMSS